MLDFLKSFLSSGNILTSELRKTLSMFDGVILSEIIYEKKTRIEYKHLDNTFFDFMNVRGGGSN